MPVNGRMENIDCGLLWIICMMECYAAMTMNELESCTNIGDVDRKAQTTKEYSKCDFHYITFKTEAKLSNVSNIMFTGTLTLDKYVKNSKE